MHLYKIQQMTSSLVRQSKQIKITAFNSSSEGMATGSKNDSSIELNILVNFHGWPSPEKGANYRYDNKEKKPGFYFFLKTEVHACRNSKGLGYPLVAKKVEQNNWLTPTLDFRKWRINEISVSDLPSHQKGKTEKWLVVWRLVYSTRLKCHGQWKEPGYAICLLTSNFALLS